MTPGKSFSLVTLSFLMFSSWVVVSATSSFPRVATPQCVAPSEVGRWRNLDDKGEPAYIDIKMVGCGDQVLNGEQTSISYTLRVWVRQSTGKFYGRPTVKATYRAWKNQQWMFGRIPTGGYEDQMWMRVVQRDGQPHLHVLIRHQSLDIKPSAQSEFWFRR